MTATLPTKNKSRDEWLKMRKSYLGASDAPAVMGVSPWTTPFQLWQDKLGLSKPREDNYNMQRGRYQEESARQLYEKKTGTLMNAEVVFHPTKKFMMASLDGLSPNGDRAAEFKCPGELDHEVAKSGKIPEKYYPQLQHQLSCLECIGINQLDYFSYRNGEGVLVEVERDKKFLERLHTEEEDFWDKVIHLESPALTNRDFESKEECLLWQPVAERLKALHQQLKSLEELEKSCRKQLIEMANESSCNGHGVRLTKVVGKGRVDYKAIPELKGVNLEIYRKKMIQSWRFTFTV